MKRRGVLGLLGGAAIAGPSMAKQAVASGLEAMQVSGSGASIGAMPLGWSEEGTDSFSDDYKSPSPLDPKHWMQAELKKFLGLSKEDKDEWRRNLHIGSLDPDLAANRSFSLSAKLSIQRERNFQREMESRERYLRNRIANAIKEWREDNLLI